MTSEFVRREWEHALSLRRTNFVRPTFWQLPMPVNPNKALPPPELAQLHFQNIATHIASESCAPSVPPGTGGVRLSTGQADASLFRFDVAVEQGRRPSSGVEHVPPRLGRINPQSAVNYAGMRLAEASPRGQSRRSTGLVLRHSPSEVFAMFASQEQSLKPALESPARALTRERDGVRTKEVRRAAVDADRTRTQMASLAEIWQALAGGQQRVADTFASDDRCYLLLTPATPDAARRSVRGVDKFDVLARTLLVGGQKAVAIDLGLAPSTVALLTKEALASMGFCCLPSQTPCFLVMAAHAVQSGRLETCRSSQVSSPTGPLRVVSVARCDLAIARLLPPAECVVTRLLVEGRRRSEIAQLRCTSQRTVANQLGAAFRRLRASGRLDLIRRLVVGDADEVSGVRPWKVARSEMDLAL